MIDNVESLSLLGQRSQISKTFWMGQLHDGWLVGWLGGWLVLTSLKIGQSQSKLLPLMHTPVVIYLVNY